MPQENIGFFGKKTQFCIYYLQHIDWEKIIILQWNFIDISWALEYCWGVESLSGELPVAPKYLQASNEA